MPANGRWDLIRGLKGYTCRDVYLMPHTVVRVLVELNREIYSLSHSITRTVKLFATFTLCGFIAQQFYDLLHMTDE